MTYNKIFKQYIGALVFCAGMLCGHIGMSVHAAQSSSTTILAKTEAFENGIRQATFNFQESFLLKPTGESETITGRVYLDKAASRIRIDYKGRVNAKVWLIADKVYFYDSSLEQVVIRHWGDFMDTHFQAFMDIPILYDIGRFKERYDFLTVEQGAVKPEKRLDTDKRVYLVAKPKNVDSYELLLGFAADTGEPVSLDLSMQNYRASLEITDFNAKATIHDKIFKTEFSKKVAVLDMTKQTQR
ncbi:MAG: hypothetical protein AABZ44_06790 [Elusimicrobiota bacterium]